MNALIYLIPVSFALGLIALWAFFWTLKNAQYEDPDGDSFRVLDEDDRPLARRTDPSQ